MRFWLLTCVVKVLRLQVASLNNNINFCYENIQFFAIA